jgi:hypothetical protein
MDPINFRMRYLIVIFFAAIVIAAVLRHVIHTYGGFSREEIRAVSLGAIVAVFLVVLFIVKKRR